MGAEAGGRYGVVSRSGVMQRGSAVQQVHLIAADAHTPPLKVLQLFFGFAVCSIPLGAFICATSVLKFSRRSRFEVFFSFCLPLCSLAFLRATTNRRSFLVLTNG